MPLLVSVLLVLTLFPVYADTSPNSIAEDGPLILGEKVDSRLQAALSERSGDESVEAVLRLAEEADLYEVEFQREEVLSLAE